MERLKEAGKLRIQRVSERERNRKREKEREEEKDRKRERENVGYWISFIKIYHICCICIYIV